MVRQALSECVATKADVEDVQGAIERLENKIKRLQTKMLTKEDLARFEMRMYVSLVATVVAIVALSKLLP